MRYLGVELDINTVKKRFLALNRERLMRMRDVLRSRQQDFIDILPLLFHANHPVFPGFVSKETPAGVSDYAPSKRSLETAKKLVKSFDYKRRALPRFDIFSIFVMGSSGTIAYSDASDFDIWLCHRPDLSPGQLKELQQKATAIEKWADTFGLEVHFFLMNADKFKAGDDVELSVESSGSAQHHLLLEEFYRTGLLVAGRYPVWWLVPPEREADYESYVKDLKLKRFIRENETIDFGGMPAAPAEEFLGAALWQLYKGVDSPYKAVLKLMLMETYAAEFPKVDLLCMRFKRIIHEGVIDLVSIDPYIMLYHKIEEYLRVKNEEDRLELVRRCFYFKVNEKLGTPDNPKYITWQREVMRELTQSWKWNEHYLQLLDTRATWKIHRVLNERKSLVDALTLSYQFLSSFAREHTSIATIDQRDLNILGRKLYAAFERKAGKIDIVNRGISDDVWESHLTFHQVGGDGGGGWTLYRGIVTAEDVRSSKPLKRSRSIVELIAWCFFNKLIDDRTLVALYIKDSVISLNEIKALIRCMNQLFPNAALVSSSMDDLTRPPKLTRSALFVNIGVESDTAYKREGMHLTSNKTDALSYGGICENLVLSFDQVLQTSWQEVLTFRYEGEKGVIDCLRSYFQWFPPSQGGVPPKIDVYCFSSGRGMAIEKRIEEFFRDVMLCYCSRHPQDSRYVFRMEYTYYVLYFEGDVLQYQKADSYNELLRLFAEPQTSFSRIVPDPHAFSDPLLPLVFQYNKPDVIQLFYRQDGAAIDVYIIDERGSLIYQRVKDLDSNLMLTQYKRFLDSVIYRQHIHMAAASDNAAARGSLVEFYQLVKGSDGNVRVSRREVGENSRGGNYFNLQVIGELAEGGNPTFTVYCDDEELTSLEFGDQLFIEVAKHVLSKRRSGLRYPIYITDIDLPRTLFSAETADHLQTMHYLTYKKNIEEKLNSALDIIDQRLQVRAS